MEWNEIILSYAGIEQRC